MGPWILAIAGVVACVREPSACPDARWAFADADGDGAGAPGTGHRTCAVSAGEALIGTDCNDADPGVRPGAAEACDGVDQDCDGAVDDGLPAATFYVDADGDGHGDRARPVTACAAPPGAAPSDGDCDDADALRHPDAPEVCNALDDDCDFAVDDADPELVPATAPRWWRDDDGDGSGGDEWVRACVAPPAAVATDGDCDDGRADVSPAAVEVCDGIDDDCDRRVDDADPSLDATSGSEWFADADGDGLGDPESAVLACKPPEGFVAHAEDCDDAHAFVGAPVQWAPDLDGDGVGGEPFPFGPTCVPPTADAAHASLGLDCDDRDARIVPGAYDPCDDGLDQDCDGADDACGPDCRFAAPAFEASSSSTFTDHQSSFTVGLAWDGASLWSASGGGPGDDRLSQYAPDGTWLADLAAQPDFRALFVQADGMGPLLARAFAAADVLGWDGAAWQASVALTGAALDDQGSVAWDPVRGEWLAVGPGDGEVLRFSADGAWVGTTWLQGFGTLGTETADPQRRRLAVTASGCRLTVDVGTLSAWDVEGTRVGTAELVGAGTGLDAHGSLSYAQGRVWVVDVHGGTWRGYDVGL